MTAMKPADCLCRMMLLAAGISLLNGCVVLLPNGAGLEQARMNQLKSSGQYSKGYVTAASVTPPGVEELSSNVLPSNAVFAEQNEKPVTSPGSINKADKQATETKNKLESRLNVASIAEIPSPVTPIKAVKPAESAEKKKQARLAVIEKGKVTIIPAKPGKQRQSLWDRLVDGFELDDKSKPAVKAILKEYGQHRRSMRRTLQKSRPYLWEIAEAVEARDMPMELALLPAVESGFNPMAQSHRRALGLWQFMPGTADHLGLEQNWWFDARLDVTESTHAALDYLEYLYSRFDDWLLALAAYNCGEARVQRAINATDGNTDFWELKLPAETRRYVPKLLALAELVEEADDYDLRLPELPNQQATDTVLFDRQVDLALAAQHADVELRTLQYLNPGLLRWATPPGGPHRIRLPAGKSKQLQQAMYKVPASQWTDWQSYQVRNGDTLSTIAQRYGIRTRDLKSINRLNGNMIRVGQTLMLPTTGQLSLALSTALSVYPGPKDALRVEYEVKSGDTLWDIARMFKVSVKALTGWNGLTTGSILRPGKKLVVWVKPNQQATEIAKG